MSPEENQVTIRDAATLLTAMLDEFFGEESLKKLLGHCKIRFPSDTELAKALREWHWFGLYVIVEGIQNNFSQTHDVGVGVAIAREFLSQYFARLPQLNFRWADILVTENDVDQRIKLYESVETTQGYERVQFAVAGLVLGSSAKPGMIPESVEAYEFSIAANRTYIGVLKAVNDFFSEYRLALKDQ
jgi:hypothetical protein